MVAVLKRVPDVFGLDIGTVVDELDHGARNQLRQLPDVAAHFDRQRRQIIGNRRRWLVTSAVLVAFGAALIYAGSVYVLGGDRIYSYESPGVVREGDPKELFHPCVGEPPSACEEQLRPRLDRVFLQTRDYRGEMFNEPVFVIDNEPALDASRTYYLHTSLGVGPSWHNKVIAAAGVLLLLVFGVVGIILSSSRRRRGEFVSALAGG